jgi:hypothetical protein
MVPVPVSFADSDSKAANSDIGAFRDDHWFVCRRSKNRQMPTSSEAEQEKGQTQQSLTFFRMRPWYSSSLYRIDQRCSRDGGWKTWPCQRLSEQQVSGRVARLIESRVRVQMM